MNEHFVISKEYDIRLIASITPTDGNHTEEQLLASLIKGCRDERSCSEILNELDNSEQTDDFVRTIYDNSIGKGHNAAGDLLSFTIDYKNVPRIETLRHARQTRGLNLMQKSTRAVEHNTVFEPDSISENPKARRIFRDAVTEAMGYYFDVLDRAGDNRKAMRQDAMYVTPLYLQTNNGITGSARGFWQQIGEGKQAHMPSICKDVSERTLQLLRKKAPKTFENYLQNYDILFMYPSNSDWLSPQEEKMEDVIREKGIGIQKYGKGAIVLGVNKHPLKDVKPQDIKKAVQERDIAFLDFVRNFNAKVLIETDMSLYHELWTQRTVSKHVEPLSNAAKRENFEIPKTLEKDKKQYEKVVKGLFNAYHKLIEENIPYGDALGVLPHATKAYSIIDLDGWNMIYLNGLRLCTKSKPGMRKLMTGISNEIKKYDSTFQEVAVPRCDQLEYCPETSSGKRPKSCNYVPVFMRGKKKLFK